MSTIKGRFIPRILAAALLTAAPLYQVNGAPGALPQAPLFLSTLVEPNVYFTLDDSGSMDWEPIVRPDAGLGTTSGLPIIDGLRRAYYTPTFSNLYSTAGGYHVVPPSNGSDPDWDQAWVVRNHLSNPNYYNPGIVYKPWPGTRAASGRRCTAPSVPSAGGRSRSRRGET